MQGPGSVGPLRAHFEREAGPDGALFVGSPETVATKIVRTVKALGLPVRAAKRLSV